MPRYTCSCGARYRLPDHSVGRKARCRKCGVIFTIPDQDIAAAVPVEDDGGYAIAADDQPAAPVATPVASAAPTGGAPRGYTPEELVAMGQAAAAGVKPRRGFWSDVAWAFLLFTDLNNLIMIMIIWFLHALWPILGFAGCLGLVGRIIIGGWLCSYWFKVILESASGEDQLPSMGLTEGALDDIVFPLLKFLAATLLAWTPAIICAVVVTVSTGLTAQEVAANPKAPMYTAIGVAMFLWPMLLLVIAIGGFSSVYRIDLIVMTVARSFLPYLAVCLLFAGTWLLQDYADTLTVRVTGGAFQNFWLTTAISALVAAYFSIVSMWIVGLYYHHFKRRFAWSWG